MKLLRENTLSDLFTDRYITYRVEKVNDLYDELVSGNLGLDDTRSKSMELANLLREVLKEVNKKYKDIYPASEHRPNASRLKYCYDSLASDCAPGMIYMMKSAVTGLAKIIFKYFEDAGYPFR